MSTPDQEQLIESLVAGELTDEELHRLLELIENNAAVEEELIEQMWLEPLLRDSFRTDPDEFVDSIRTALDDGDRESDQFAQRLLGAWSERTEKRLRRRMAGIAAGAGLVMAAVLFAVLFFPNGENQKLQAAPVVRLQNMTGTVEASDRDGRTRAIKIGGQLEPGETITTRGESSCTVSWGENSHLTMTRDASLTWPAEHRNQILLNAGLAKISRSNSAIETPFSLTTQYATIDIGDTDLLLAVSDRQTDVTVTRGIARVTGSNGQSLNVSNGECGVVKQDAVELRRGSATPDTWDEDFESGLPKGWEGQFVNAELPQGSRGAVQTTESTNDEGESCHQLWSHSEWQHGLSVIHDDTCLNFVYRFKTADTVQVLTLLRSPMPHSPDYEVQILQPTDVPEDERWWNVPPDKWYTVSIPLSRLTNPVTLKSPPESFVATAFNFRAQNHACRLAIDRMWIARGTSTKIEFKPLEEQP